MKVAFKVPKAELENAYVRMENNNLLVCSIVPLLRRDNYGNVMGLTIVEDGTSAIFYLSIDKTVQYAGYFAGGTVDTQVGMTTLDNSVMETFDTIQPNAVVNSFIRGTTYLIPWSAFACVNMLPKNESVLVGGTMAVGTVTGTIFSTTHFRFDASEDSDILGNGGSINGCITVHMKGDAVLAVEQQRAVKKTSEVLNFATAINTPGAAQAIQLVNSKASLIRS